MNIKFPKISIYDKYIFRQVAGATIAAVLLFTIVWIAPEILLNTIGDIQTIITCTGLDEFVNNNFRIDKVINVVKGTISCSK